MLLRLSPRTTVRPSRGGSNADYLLVDQRGSGTTVVAALAALHAAQKPDHPVLLVDLGGDLPGVFGAAEPPSGLSEWLHSDLSSCSLDQALCELTPGLSLLPRGHGSLSARRAEELIEWLTTDATVVVDAGVLHSDNGLPPAAIELAWKLAAEADRSILVTRACYLALRRTASLTLRPSGVVLVAEAGRALTRADCEQAIGASVLATVAVDPDIARAVDARMLRTRVPKGAVKALDKLLEAG